MEITTKQEQAERAFQLQQNITTCLLNIRDNYLALGRYASELKKNKMYKLLMPDAESWEYFISKQSWGIKRASLDNYAQVASTIGNEIEDRDIKLNRAIDITRIVGRLQEPERGSKIAELIESAETLPKSGWDDTVKVESGKTPSDMCDHENLESWSRCKNCGKFIKL